MVVTSEATCRQSLAQAPVVFAKVHISKPALGVMSGQCKDYIGST